MQMTSHGCRPGSSALGDDVGSRREATWPMPLQHPSQTISSREEISVAPLFSSEPLHVPRHRMPDGELAPDIAYQIIHDELMLDGNARLNLATFVTTWMEPQAELLMAECLDKNMIDKDEYPADRRAGDALRRHPRRLWHAPETPSSATGCSTTGSSEAAMLGGLALKRRWQQRAQGRGQADRQAEHRHGHQRPGVLGEVRELLGRRDAPGPDGRGPLPPLGRGGGRAL